MVDKAKVEKKIAKIKALEQANGKDWADKAIEQWNLIRTTEVEV